MCFRLSSVEQYLGHTEDMVAEHTTALCFLQTKVRALENKAEDAENCNHRNNLCIMGLAESAEGPKPMIFVEELFRNCYLQPNFHPTTLWRHHPSLDPHRALSS